MESIKDMLRIIAIVEQQNAGLNGTRHNSVASTSSNWSLRPLCWSLWRHRHDGGFTTTPREIQKYASLRQWSWNLTEGLASSLEFWSFWVHKCHDNTIYKIRVFLGYWDLINLDLINPYYYVYLVLLVLLVVSRQRRRLGRPSRNWRKEEPTWRRKFHVPKYWDLDWVAGQLSLDSWIKSIKRSYIASSMTTLNLPKTRLKTPHTQQINQKNQTTWKEKIKRIQFLDAAPILFSNSATEKIEEGKMSPTKEPSWFQHSMTNKLHFISHARIKRRHSTLLWA